MRSCRDGLGGALAAALGTATWLAAAGPAEAGGVRSDAREGCREELADQGYGDVEIDTARRRDGGERVMVRGEAEQGGDAEGVKCVYDTEQDKARVPD
jgi:hypothetical protein